MFQETVTAVDVNHLISAMSSLRIDHAATWRSLLQVDLTGESLRACHLQMLLAQLSGLVCKPQGEN